MLAAIVTGGETETSRARLVAKVAAAIADRTPEGVAQGLPEAVPLAELMMICLSLGMNLLHVPWCVVARETRGGGVGWGRVRDAYTFGIF